MKTTAIVKEANVPATAVVVVVDDSKTAIHARKVGATVAVMAAEKADATKKAVTVSVQNAMAQYPRKRTTKTVAKKPPTTMTRQRLIVRSAVAAVVVAVVAEKTNRQKSSKTKMSRLPTEIRL
jgi:hypothetical protein